MSLSSIHRYDKFSSSHVTLIFEKLKRLPSPKIGVPAPAHLMDLSIPDLAKQLCLMDAKLASDVKLCEFFDSSWTVGKSPGIRKISEFTNTLTYALANDVLSANNKQKRIKTLGRILKLGKVLFFFVACGITCV